MLQMQISKQTEDKVKLAKKYIEGLIYRYNRQVQGSFDARKITKIKLEQNCDHDDQEQAH